MQDFGPLMSALGHKPTCAAQKSMSALPRIATAKANSRKRSGPLYPQEQTCAVQLQMSALGQKRTSYRKSRIYLAGTRPFIALARDP
jgi:hypothetical protein